MISVLIGAERLYVSYQFLGADLRQIEQESDEIF